MNDQLNVLNHKYGIYSEIKADWATEKLNYKNPITMLVVTITYITTLAEYYQ